MPYYAEAFWIAFKEEINDDVNKKVFSYDDSSKLFEAMFKKGDLKNIVISDDVIKKWL